MHLKEVLPVWFHSSYVFMEIAFALITLIVSLYAFKIYFLSNQRQSKLFGFAFLFISIAYSIDALIGLGLLSSLINVFTTNVGIPPNSIYNLIGNASYYSFFLLGLITLTYMTLKIESQKTYSLLIIVSALGLVLSANKEYLYFLLTSIYLTYIGIYYLINYLNVKDFKTLLVVIAFSFLFMSNIHFVLNVDHAIYSIIGLFLELFAYLFILINLILLIKKGKKKENGKKKK